MSNAEIIFALVGGITALVGTLHVTPRTQLRLVVFGILLLFTAAFIAIHSNSNQVDKVSKQVNSIVRPAGCPIIK